MSDSKPVRSYSPRLSRRQFNLSLGATAATIGNPLFAQSAWPNKPIRIIVPYTPGGFTDQMARLVQAGLQNRLQQSVTIDNKPGANSIIGVDMLAKAPADGTTFAVVIAALSGQRDPIQRGTTRMFLPGRGQRVAKRTVEHLAKRPADRLGPTYAVELLEGAVPSDDAILDIDHDQPIVE